MLDGESLYIRTDRCTIEVSAAVQQADGTQADVVQVRRFSNVAGELTTESNIHNPLSALVRMRYKEVK